MEQEVYLTSDLARAARAFTKVSVRTIAETAGLKKKQVRRFEQGGSLPAAERNRLKESLEKYGALFIPEDSVAGYGVRRKFPREKLMKLNTWEGEGGATT